ncbi:MAG: YihY/virulence factor BrkB family protein [Methylophilaceae bacterium]|nr:YihY/virulence factor BrkB family protein [Methylophilaceae bacterium]
MKAFTTFNDVLANLKDVLLASITAWFDHRGASKGAALAFYTLFSLAPVLVLAIALAGYFFGVDAAQGRIVGEVKLMIGASGADIVQSMLLSARNPADGLIATLIATSLMLLGATTMFIELKESLDEIWAMPAKSKTHGVNRIAAKPSVIALMIRTRLLAFGIVLVLGFLLLISLVLSAVLGLLQHYLSGLFPNASVFFFVLSNLISIIIIIALFAVIFKMLPNVALSWGDVTTGAIFTAVLFGLGKYGIGVYLGNNTISSSFGAAGSVIALLLWIYYSSQIFFFGAEFTRQYALHFGSMKSIK